MTSNDRTARLYPSGAGLAWARDNVHPLAIMHFHMQTASDDYRNSIPWEQDETRGNTEYHYTIEGTTPVDHDPNGSVGQKFEAEIKDGNALITYSETCDIVTGTTHAGEATVVAACRASLKLPYLLPASLEGLIDGKQIRDVVCGDHPLIQAIGDLTIRTALTSGRVPAGKVALNLLNQPQLILEIDCTEWKTHIEKVHKAFEASRLTKEAENA